MAAFKEPPKFNVVPGNAADVTAIQDAGSVLNPSITDLFPAIYQLALAAGGKAPERTTFNQFLKLYGEKLYFMERGGVWSYDATADYPAGAVVGYSGALYLALKDNGEGTDAGAVAPDADGEVWQRLETAADLAKVLLGYLPVAAAEADYLKKSDAASAYVQTGAVDQTVGGTKTFSKPMVGSVTGSSGSCTGNAATATKLATARTINGIAFDGTANITIPVTVPTGVIIPFAGTSVPTGYLLCNGALVSRTDYADLFAAVGTLYGAGDGSTTFALPDLRDRVLQGASGTHSAGSYIAAGLPNIYGTTDGYNGFLGADGAFALNNLSAVGGGNTYPNVYHGFNFNASRSSSLYGASDTVQMAAVAAQYLIRY